MTDIDKKDFIEIAKYMMEYIQCDNGYHHVEGISFPAKWVKKIAKKAEIFFTANPDKLDNEEVDRICCGCEDECEDLFLLPGYSELHKVLNEYFDDGMNTGRVEIKPRLLHTYKPIKRKWHDQHWQIHGK